MCAEPLSFSPTYLFILIFLFPFSDSGTHFLIIRLRITRPVRGNNFFCPVTPYNTVFFLSSWIHSLFFVCFFLKIFICNVFISQMFRLQFDSFLPYVLAHKWLKHNHNIRQILFWIPPFLNMCITSFKLKCLLDVFCRLFSVLTITHLKHWKINLSHKKPFCCVHIYDAKYTTFHFRHLPHGTKTTPFGGGEWFYYIWKLSAL